MEHTPLDSQLARHSADYDDEDRRGVWVPRWAMEACEGDARDAVVLSEITYWLQPSQKSGKPRTTRLLTRDDGYWLYSTDEQIADRLGMNKLQVWRARGSLKKRGLIECQRGVVGGQNVTLIQVVGLWIRPEAVAETRSVDPDKEPESPRLDGEAIANPRRAVAQSRSVSVLCKTSKTTKPPSRAAETLRSVDNPEEADDPSPLCQPDQPQPAAETAPLFDVPPEPPLDPLRGFAEFWTAWPARNGKKLQRAKAEAAWSRLDLPTRFAAYRAACNYADASNRGMAGAMDAFRWLRDRLWVEWQDPAVATPTPQRRSEADDHFEMAQRLHAKLVAEDQAAMA